MRPQSEAPAKKPYQQPKLLLYGNLTEMTLSKGNSMIAHLDGAKTPLNMRKTA
jgi:hypothetical protein